MCGLYLRACAWPMHTVRKWQLVSILRTPELPIIIAFQPDTLVRPLRPDPFSLFVWEGLARETKKELCILIFCQVIY